MPKNRRQVNRKRGSRSEAHRQVGEEDQSQKKPRDLLQVRNLQRRIKVDRSSLHSFLCEVAKAVDAEGVSSTLVLVGDARMRVLNRLFRGYDHPTDVLSFAADKTELSEDETYLGDIVISVETAHRQALRRGSDLERELRVLTLHGFLHLLGYDHEADDGHMRRFEYRLRRKLGITRPRKKNPKPLKTAARRRQ